MASEDEAEAALSRGGVLVAQPLEHNGPAAIKRAKRGRALRVLVQVTDRREQR